jgi:hypothetical protein
MPNSLNIAPPTVDVQTGFPHIITPQNPVVGLLLLRVVIILAVLASSCVGHEEQLVEMVCYLVACPVFAKDVRWVFRGVDPIEVHHTCSDGLTNLVIGECNMPLAQLRLGNTSAGHDRLVITEQETLSIDGYSEISECAC